MSIRTTASRIFRPGPLLAAILIAVVAGQQGHLRAAQAQSTAVYPNSPYVIGPNAIVIQNGSDPAAAADRVRADSLLSVDALWLLSREQWLYYVPSMPSVSTLRSLAPLASAFVVLSAPREVQLSDTDNGRAITLASGGTLIIAMASNPSTGYSWTIAPRASSSLDPQGPPVYVPPGSTVPVPGAGGTEVFTFLAYGHDTVQLTLLYRRSFEPNEPPAKVFSVTVHIV